jgi:UDP-GlcNAc3NAcA epimerase
MKKILTVVGARPQFVKCAAISQVLRTQIEEVLVHTGQHYDYSMSDIFFEELSIPKPNHHLGVGSGKHGAQTGEMLAKLEAVIMDERPHAVMVYGDTNSTLAAALAASKHYIPVIHIEAGLRSFNRQMPEEINRVLTDHASSLLLCPTATAVNNLRREGFENIVDATNFLHDEKVIFCSPEHPIVANVGDVMYDMIRIVKDSFSEEYRRGTLKKFGVEYKKFAIATIHRAENTNTLSALRSVIQALSHIGREFPVLLPLHPRTRGIIDREQIEIPASLVIMEPQGYKDMILLQESASIVLTDSGGMQKEAFLLRTPCITMREQTEWLETVECGWNVLTGAQEEEIIGAFRRMDEMVLPPQLQPFGDSYAGAKITDAILRFIQS